MTNLDKSMSPGLIVFAIIIMAIIAWGDPAHAEENDDTYMDCYKAVQVSKIITEATVLMDTNQLVGISQSGIPDWKKTFMDALDITNQEMNKKCAPFTHGLRK